MRRLHLLALIAALALTAAACAGDDGTAPTGGGTTPAGGGTTPAATGSPLNNQGTQDVTSMSSFTLEIDEFYFKPTFLKATAGQALNIELENESSTTHTFTITALNINEQLNGGQKKEINLTLPAGGGSDLAFFCQFHVGSGMRGAFFFGASPSATEVNDTGYSY